ncbi:hypothetical protein [Jatrophihabitans fulvus]
MNPRRWFAGLAAAAVLCVGGSVALASPADVAPSRPALEVGVDGHDYSTMPSAALSLDGAAPGSTTATDLAIRSGLDRATSLSLRLIPDDCAGCQADPLSDSLSVEVSSAEAPSGPYVQVWSGTGRDLGGDVDTDVVLAPGGDAWVRVAVGIPTSSGNEVADRLVAFALRITLTDPDLGVAAASAGAGRDGELGAGGANRSRRGGVAITGASVMLAAAGVLLAGCGVVLLLAGRRRPATPGPAPGRAR